MEILKIKEELDFKKLEKLGFEKRYSTYTGELCYYEQPEEDIEVYLYDGKATEMIINKEELKESTVILLIKMYKEKLIEVKKDDEKMSTLDEMILK